MKTEGPIFVTSPCLASFSLDVEWSNIVDLSAYSAPLSSKKERSTYLSYVDFFTHIMAYGLYKDDCVSVTKNAAYVVTYE